MGSTVAHAEQRLPTDEPCALGAVQEAEDLVHGYWRQLSPLYLPKRDHHQH
jgi:hypothetical protein